MVPIIGTNINGCDCPGSALVNGTLIDGVIPSTDTAQRGTWASELFVVNRNGQDSIVIGFQFSEFFLLRSVEVMYLDCPIWGTGFSAVNISSSQLFPNYLTVAFTTIVWLSLVNNTDSSCSFFRAISIPLQQPTISTHICFIEFTFGGSSACPVSWLHLAEIMFSDVAPTTVMPATLSKFNVYHLIYYDIVGLSHFLFSSIK